MQAQGIMGETKGIFKDKVIKRRGKLGDKKNEKHGAFHGGQTQIEQKGHSENGLPGGQKNFLQLVAVEIYGRHDRSRRYGIYAGNHADKQGPLI